MTSPDTTPTPEEVSPSEEMDPSSSRQHLWILNITSELPIDYAQPLYGYVMPFLLAVTIVANTLIVVVLSKRHMRTPTNVVLMAMALSDMFTLLFPAPWLLYMYTFDNHDKPLSPPSACYLWYIMNEVIPNLFHTASIWLTVALAVQRYIYVCHAMAARTLCTMRRILNTIAGIMLAAALHQSVRFFDRTFVPVEAEWRGTSVAACARQYSILVTDIIPIDFFYFCYFGFRVIFVHVLPCAVLVVLNFLLLRALKRAERQRKRIFGKNHKSHECKKLRDANCTTLMLIVVVSVILLVEIPLAVVTVLHIIHSLFFEVLDYESANVLILFTNFLIIVSYPINFAIYCGMSRQFRETFKDLFVRGAVGTLEPERTNTGLPSMCTYAPRKNGTQARLSITAVPRPLETAL